MRPEAFKNWLAAMKSAGLARSDAECARLLGVTANGVAKMKRNGTTHSTALACRALFHRLEPWAWISTGPARLALVPGSYPVPVVPWWVGGPITTVKKAERYSKTHVVETIRKK